MTAVNSLSASGAVQVDQPANEGQPRKGTWASAVKKVFSDYAADFKKYVNWDSSKSWKQQSVGLYFSAFLNGFSIALLWATLSPFVIPMVLSDVLIEKCSQARGDESSKFHKMPFLDRGYSASPPAPQAETVAQVAMNR